MIDDEMTTRELARVIHELHRQIANAQNDPFPNEPFDSLTAEMQWPTINMVRLIKAGATREEVQDAWCDWMRQRGIVPGRVKDLNAVPPTHPGIKRWAELGKWDRRKVETGFCVVEKLTGKS